MIDDMEPMSGTDEKNYIADQNNHFFQEKLLLSLCRREDSVFTLFFMYCVTCFVCFVLLCFLVGMLRRSGFIHQFLKGIHRLLSPKATSGCWLKMSMLSFKGVFCFLDFLIYKET